MQIYIYIYLHIYICEYEPNSPLSHLLSRRVTATSWNLSARRARRGRYILPIHKFFLVLFAGYYLLLIDVDIRHVTPSQESDGDELEFERKARQTVARMASESRINDAEQLDMAAFFTMPSAAQLREEAQVIDRYKIFVERCPVRLSDSTPSFLSSTRRNS